MTMINGDKKVLPQRLSVTAGMSWYEIDRDGNSAQKQSRIIFDADGNGRYDEREAKVFNSTRVSVQTDKNGIKTVKVYNKKNNKLITTVVLDKETQSLYDDLYSKHGVFAELKSILECFGGSKDNYKQLENLHKEISMLQEQLHQKTNYKEIFMNEF